MARAWSFPPLCFALLFALCVLCVLCTPLASHAARIVISCGSLGKEFEVCRSGAQAWAGQTGNTVDVLASPGAAGERLSQMQLLLAAKSPDIDIFLVDTTWPGMLADFFIDLNLNPRARKVRDSHFPSFIRNNTIQDRWIAVPWFIDAGVLFYRQDLLDRHHEKPPASWEELTRIARKIQAAEREAGRSHFWGFVFEGRAYEGLTCNALEWIANEGGAPIISPDGQVLANSPPARRAARLASSWVGSISPRGVLNYMEEEARGVFQSGNALFLRNWPYVWKLATASDSPVRGKIGMSPLPGGKGVLGGWSLAVSRFSRHPDEATDLVLYLSSASEQKRRSVILGQNPTIPALYRDPELLQDNPALPTLLQVFENAVARPSVTTGSRYNRVSSEFWDAFHRILSGEEDPGTVLAELQKRLVFLSRGGQW